MSRLLNPLGRLIDHFLARERYCSCFLDLVVPCDDANGGCVRLVGFVGTLPSLFSGNEMLPRKRFCSICKS